MIGDSLKPARVSVAGALIDRYTLDQATAAIVERASSGDAPVYVLTPNAHHVALLERSPEFREIYRHAWLVVPDGISLVWASRLLGDPLPGRVGGVDLFEAVCAAAAGTGVGVFLLGGRPGAADEAARVLARRHPGLLVAGTHCPPFGFESDPRLAEEALEAVRRAAPDILFVGLGAPKQERWIYRNLPRLGVPVVAGVGASFDFVSGQVRRAPRWAQRAGLEWLFRVATEPRRLGRRYAHAIPRFAWLVAKQLVLGRRSGVDRRLTDDPSVRR